MKITRLQKKIKKALERNRFEIVNEAQNDDKLIIVSKFGTELDQSTFFVHKSPNLSGLLVGANLSLDITILTKSIVNKIQSIASQYNVSSSPPEYKDGEGAMALQMVYNYSKFRDDDLVLYVNDFKQCIIAIYNEIKRCISPEDLAYLDLSMFEGVDWALFDPYIYIIERDKRFDGSWEKYIFALKINLDQSGVKAELDYVEKCKSFEDKNNIPIDVACEYIVDKAMSYDLEDKDKTSN